MRLLTYKIWLLAFLGLDIVILISTEGKGGTDFIVLAVLVIGFLGILTALEQIWRKLK
jgi:hypothetical protein